MKNAAQLLVNKLPKLKVSFAKLTQNEVLVGVPAEKTDRKFDPSEPKQDINNATLAYLNDKGSPANNIPARPFMELGIESQKTNIVKDMQAGAKSALSADDSAVDKTLNKVGLRAQLGIRNAIQEITPGPAEATLKARKRKGFKGEKALIVTGQLRNSINYVIRRKTRASS